MQNSLQRIYTDRNRHIPKHPQRDIGSLLRRVSFEYTNEDKPENMIRSHNILRRKAVVELFQKLAFSLYLLSLLFLKIACI